MKRALSKASIFDNSRRIASTGQNLLLPILVEPPISLQAELADIGLFEVLDSDLPKPRPSRPTLRRLLDGEVPLGLISLIPKSFDVLGDLVLLEPVSDSLLPYINSIGNALLKLNKSAHTVLLKTGKVDGIFRVPSYTFVAGVDKRKTTSTEYGVRLNIDVSKVYYSPRLGCERNRVASLVGDGETVVDMFAGVGPFSILIARRRMAKVYSIDINPDAVALLRENISMNKLRGEVVPILGNAAAVSNTIAGVADRVIMNLPKSSLDFFDAALRVLKSSGGIVHLYVFSGGDPVQGAAKLLEHRAKPPGVSCTVERTKVVKEVAPHEYMVALDLKIAKN